MFLFRWRKGEGGCTNACICMGTQSAFTTESLNGCLWNLVGMKYSWPCTCIKMFRPYPPRGGSRVKQKLVTWGGGPLLQKTSSSDWKATATNQMHSNDLEACEMKRSQIFDTLTSLITEVLIVLRWAISAPWGSSWNYTGCTCIQFSSPALYI